MVVLMKASYFHLPNCIYRYKYNLCHIFTSSVISLESFLSRKPNGITAPNNKWGAKGYNLFHRLITISSTFSRRVLMDWLSGVIHHGIDCFVDHSFSHSRRQGVKLKCLASNDKFVFLRSLTLTTNCKNVFKARVTRNDSAFCRIRLVWNSLGVPISINSIQTQHNYYLSLSMQFKHHIYIIYTYDYVAFELNW